MGDQSRRWDVASGRDSVEIDGAVNKQDQGLLAKRCVLSWNNRNVRLFASTLVTFRLQMASTKETCGSALDHQRDQNQYNLQVTTPHQRAALMQQSQAISSQSISIKVRLVQREDGMELVS
jgi:hypothetical protein